ncbi:MAG: hypothetical protein L6V90_02255 [Treponema succinifaciens]|nr:MAG: hypothetical protein L6V90_02255 [Treponema succinifaciens]
MFICNSCIADKVPRYDIQGKKVLSTFDKYYLADVSLARIHSVKIDIGASLENIVYNELKCRGYEVYIGALKKMPRLIFVAQKKEMKKALLSGMLSSCR